MNAVYFASQLHAILSFRLARFPMGTSDDSPIPDWLHVMRYRFIPFNKPSIVNCLRQGVWNLMVESHMNWQQRSERRIAASIKQPMSKAIKALKHYSDELTGERSSFHKEQLQFLAMLEKVPPISDAIGAYLSFITETPQEYIRSLRGKNTFSLLLLLHWCILTFKLDQWWLSQVAAAERRRLQHYLLRYWTTETKTGIAILNR